MNPEIQELEIQTGLVLAALGSIFAKTLVADDVPPMVLKTLSKKGEEMHLHLQSLHAEQAARMLAPFLRALKDPKLFPHPT